MASISGDTTTGMLVDLPGMIQSIASQRRDAVLTLTAANREPRRLFFIGGQLSGVSGPPARFFARALVWAQVLTAEQLSTCLESAGKGVTPDRLTRLVLDQNLTTPDGLLDALDCYIEEAFSEVLGWSGPQIDFAPGLSDDPWLKLQSELGVSINPGSLLLEGLRRQDELGAVASLLPDPWDVLVRDSDIPPPDDLGEDATLVITGWTGGLIANILTDRSLLPPFRATIALATLLRRNVVRIAGPDEVVVHADAAHTAGRYRDAYGLYRRAAALGLDTPRLHLHLGELAERFGELDEAARQYIAAATALEDPSHAVVLLRNALGLTSDRLPVLQALLSIYDRMGERDEAANSLLEILRLHEQRGELDLAIAAARRAHDSGADPVTCASILARLHAARGDIDQAALQYELAAHAAQFASRNDEAVNAWRELLRLRPRNPEYARECGELLADLQMADEAIAIVRKALVDCTGAGDEALIPLYEVLERLAPNDTETHNWLAQAYSRRRDRDGATMQLLLVADAQERAGELHALANTLERIVELGDAKSTIWVRLAKARERLKQTGLAGAAWCSAVDAIGLSDLRAARATADEGLGTNPACMPLRARLAHIATRTQDHVTASAAFRSAIDLARGSGNLAEARELLLQFSNLRPDDLIVHIELADVARMIADPDLDRFYRNVVRSATRTGNFGLAVDFARRRIDTAPNDELVPVRSELVELLRRSGDAAAELAEGRALVDQLLEQGRFEDAVQILSRLVASHNRDADLVVQLADLHHAIDDSRQAHRLYRHAVVLLQADGRTEEALHTLDQLQALKPGDRTISMARERLQQGQAIDWDALRTAIAQQNRQALATTTTPRPGSM